VTDLSEVQFRMRSVASRMAALRARYSNEYHPKTCPCHLCHPVSRSNLAQRNTEYPSSRADQT